MEKHSGKYRIYLQKKKYFVYFITIILIYLLRFIDGPVTIIQAFLFILLWYMPFKMNLIFKAINILVLSYFIIVLPRGIFSNDGLNIKVMMLAVVIFVSLIINIFVVIRDLYYKNQSRSRYNISNGFKLIFLLSVFTILVFTVLFSFSIVYSDLNTLSPEHFRNGDEIQFNSLYYSAVTYFTVGYGDILPVSPYARAVSVIQMIMSYAITCLIVPVLLVAIQRLIKSTHDGSKKIKEE